jgi:large subunit ribosomal protein L5
MTTNLKKEYQEQLVPQVMKQRNYKNINEVPKLSKVVVNCCVGSSQDVKAALDDALKDISLITGQRPLKTRSRKAIANFKLRDKQDIGCKVTLRGKMMYEFMLRLTRMALPRIRDFRGVSARAFDGRGAYTLGVKDHTIFPEIELDKIKRNLGMDITIVTTGKNKEETKELLTLLGMPFADRVAAAAKAKE